MLLPGIWDVDVHCLTLVILDDTIDGVMAQGTKIDQMGIWDAKETSKSITLRLSIKAQ